MKVFSPEPFWNKIYHKVRFQAGTELTLYSTPPHVSGSHRQGLRDKFANKIAMLGFQRKLRKKDNF